VTKTHQLHIPAKAAKDWIITRFDPEERKILRNNIEELLEEANNLAEDSLYSEDGNILAQSLMRLVEAIRALTQVLT
jgi:hypothetical protein